MTVQYYVVFVFGVYYYTQVRMYASTIYLVQYRGIRILLC
jgi:hypothetical protein